MSKPEGQGTALSADLLYERALAIIDEKGFEALSMRRLASDLGVEAASLYHHVPNKQALLDGALALMRSEMQVSPESSGGWIEDMEEVFVEYRRVLAAHPNMVLLAGRRLDNGTENGIAYLMDAGFTLDDAVELMQSLASFVVGFSMFSSLDIDKGDLGLSTELAARMRDWRDDTCRRTLRLLLESFESRLDPSGAAH